VICAGKRTPVGQGRPTPPGDSPLPDDLSRETAENRDMGGSSRSREPVVQQGVLGEGSRTPYR